MRSLSVALLALGLGLMSGCRGGSDSPSRQQVDRGEDKGQTAGTEPTPGHTLRAAGVEFTVPLTWTVVEEQDPHFAMAWGPTDDPSHVSLCTIELSRQGPGAMPAGIVPSASAGATDYAHGPMRGRLRELPGPTSSATVLVHCREHRSTGQWRVIEAAFESLKPPQTPAELPPLIVDQLDPSEAGETIVELCAGTTARQTMVCARRADGAVFCGSSTGEALTEVEGITPATQLSCERGRSCSLDAQGQVSCWRPKQAPAQLQVDGPVRDIAGDCVVDARGRLMHHRREIDGSTTDALTELLPLGDAAHALTEVERVLAGSNEDHGCVLRDVNSKRELWCWDRNQALGLELLAPGHPQLVDTPIPAATPAPKLSTIGGRVCVGAAGQWTCQAGTARFEFDGCERRACGCSLVGATRMSCDDEPHERIDARVFGRISDVVAISGPCAARLDGTVVCRGPAAGRTDDDARVTQAVAGGVPGVAHVLDLHARDP